jgi:hypothetical protein
MAVTRRLAVCTIGLPVNSGDFEATGLISIATSDPDDERPEIQITWIVSKVPYFSTLVISIKLVALNLPNDKRPRNPARRHRAV